MGFFDRSKSMSGKSKPPVRITSTSQHGEQQQTVLSPNNNNENPFEFDRLNQSLKSTFDEEETTTNGPAAPSVQGAQPRSSVNKKKRLGIAAAVLLVLLALTIGLAVGLSGRKGGSGERGSTGGGDTAGQAQEQEEEGDDEETQLSSGRERSEWEIQAYLLEVLSPHTPMDHLLDATRPQGHAFSALKSMEQAGAPATADATVLQRYALLTLFLATNGLFGWTGQIFDINNPDFCTWNGVECSTTVDGEPVVTSLKLDSINLGGTIPDEICLLGSHLETLVLTNNNKLSGAIPACFVQFGTLQTLDLSHNDLTGGMPLLGYSSNLVTVNVSHNRLTGSLNHLLLPTNSLPQLQELQLNDNGFTGPVPSAVLSRQGALTTLELTDNQLTGVVSVCVTTVTADCAEVLCDCCSNCR